MQTTATDPCLTDRYSPWLVMATAVSVSGIFRLEYALRLTRKQRLPFDPKYGISSEHFIADMAAEDLQGGDEEYIQWAGEYRLMQRLERRSLV